MLGASESKPFLAHRRKLRLGGLEHAFKHIYGVPTLFKVCFRCGRFIMNLIDKNVPSWSFWWEGSWAQPLWPVPELPLGRGPWLGRPSLKWRRPTARRSPPGGGSAWGLGRGRFPRGTRCLHWGAVCRAVLARRALESPSASSRAAVAPHSSGLSNNFPSEGGWARARRDCSRWAPRGARHGSPT